MADQSGWNSNALAPRRDVLDSLSSWGDDASQKWLGFKEQHPKTALALSLLPVTAQLTAAAEYYDAIKRGDTTDAALAAIQLIPMGGAVKAGKAAVEATKHARGLEQAAKTTFGPALRSQQTGTALATLAAASRKEARMQAGIAGVSISADGSNLLEGLPVGERP